VSAPESRDLTDALSPAEILDLVDTRGSEPQRPRDPIADCGLTALLPGADVLDAAVCLRRLAAGANGADPLDREVVRVRAIRELERAGVSPAARMVDAVLPRPTAGGDGEDPTQGTGIAFAAVPPWAESVDGTDLLAELVRTLARFVVLPEGAATAAALWIVHAHALDATAVSALLAALSPEKRCGKTTLLELLGALVPRPLPAANITPAALFRAVERFGPTLLVDEADSFMAGSDELRGILNSGHRRASAYVVRCVGDDQEPRTFTTWAAKAVASIGSLPGTLEDRSIVIRMRRRRPDERIEPLRLDRLGALEPLRRRAARWVADSGPVLKAADPAVPPELHDRAADNWRPLLAIADAAGGPWPERARRAAVLLSGADSDDAPRELLLGDLRELFRERGADRLSTTDALDHLTQLETRPWPEWRHGQPLTARGLARLLAPLGIIPGTVRDGAATWKGYRAEQFSDAWARYLSPTPSTDPSHRHIPAAARVSGDSVSVTPEKRVTDRDAPKVARPRHCDAVTDSERGEGQAKPVCAYGHREVWTDQSGNRVCGVCHPQPVPGRRDVDRVEGVGTDGASPHPPGQPASEPEWVFPP
jgi:putative DNA primase/helicase